MLLLTFSIAIILLCITFIILLLRFFKAQLKSSYKMLSKFQDDAERALLENRRLEAYIDNLVAEIDKKRSSQGEQKK
jgi:F0F1-type ATP synthase membrane subunit b/b'